MRVYDQVSLPSFSAVADSILLMVVYSVVLLYTPVKDDQSNLFR